MQNAATKGCKIQRAKMKANEIWPLELVVLCTIELMFT